MRLDLAIARRRVEPQRIGVGLYALHAAGASDAAAPSVVLGIETIAEALAQAAQTTHVRVEVDAAWARLFVLPWSPALSTARRWEQFAASRFAQRYDCASEDWVIRVLPARPPHARLVVALPRALVEACLGACGKRLACLEVGVLTWLQTVAAAPRDWSGCRVEIDDLQAWIFVFQRGVLVRVRARRERTSEALVAAIEAEWAASASTGAQPQACPVHWGPRAQAVGLDRAVPSQSSAAPLPAQAAPRATAVPA